MKKILTGLLIAVCLAVACAKKVAVIYNGCKGSWLTIRHNNDILIQRLDYGQDVSLDTVRYVAGNNTSFILTAKGFSVHDNTPLGETSMRFTIQGSSYGFTSPDLPSWNITSLNDSSSKTGCEQ